VTDPLAGEIKKERRCTLPEALDAAQDGAQFGRVIQELFRSLETAIDAEKEGKGKP
jgi:hypothetical protein